MSDEMKAMCSACSRAEGVSVADYGHTHRPCSSCGDQTFLSVDPAVAELLALRAEVERLRGALGPIVAHGWPNVLLLLCHDEWDIARAALASTDQGAEPGKDQP